MSVLTTGARRRTSRWPLPNAAEVAPYGAISLCSIPTPDGSGATIHPSVLDMGQAWNGYRWWMANTPWPNSTDSLENPCIYGSNDRINWEVPPGLVNPIEAWAGVAGQYNSDTELIWDAPNQRMVCLWRFVAGGGPAFLHAKTSTDGISWSDLVVIHEMPYGASSPTVAPSPTGGWLLLYINQWAYFESSDLLGPYVVSPGTVTRPSGFGAYHGAFIRHGAEYLTAFTIGTSPKQLYLSRSTNGKTWGAAQQIGSGPITSSPYRPCLLPSTKPGWVDIWHSGSVPTDVQPGGVGTLYTRVPLSAFGPA